MHTRVKQRTVARNLIGEYRPPGRCHLAYTVQPGDPSRGVEVGYAGGVTQETVEYLRRFQTGVDQLVAQRAGEGVELVGIDITVEFLDGCSGRESCTYGYAFMYDVVESETEEVLGRDQAPAAGPGTAPDRGDM
jgi:hypothetical protein